MIYNLNNSVKYFYYCNSIDDGYTLKAFINKILSMGILNFTVNVIGKFGCTGVEEASDSKSYHFVYEYSGDGAITLDFSGCNAILPVNNFMYVKNITVRNCYISYSSITAIGFNGDSAKYIDCTVRGTFKGATGSICFSGSSVHCIGCYVSIEQIGGNVYGFDVTESVIDRCMVHIKSDYSCYGVRALETSQVSNSRFSALSTNTVGSNSGTGGIGGGNFTNCIFIGRGASVGYGFVQSDGYVVNSINCTYRGYTASSTGNGIGYRSNNSDTNGVYLIGVNCNQVDLSGYRQTQSARVYGHGVVAGHFYTGGNPVFGTNINQLSVINRNRVN